MEDTSIEARARKRVGMKLGFYRMGLSGDTLRERMLAREVALLKEREKRS